MSKDSKREDDKVYSPSVAPAVIEIMQSGGELDVYRKKLFAAIEAAEQKKLSERTKGYIMGCKILSRKIIYDFFSDSKNFKNIDEIRNVAQALLEIFKKTNEEMVSARAPWDEEKFTAAIGTFQSSTFQLLGLSQIRCTEENR